MTGSTPSYYLCSITQHRGFYKVFIMGKDKTPKRLEDYKPGASKEQVFDSLLKVAGAKKKPKKADLPPEQASS